MRVSDFLDSSLWCINYLSVDDYVDYDSDYDEKARTVVEADPYAGEYIFVFYSLGVFDGFEGVFFSKDRREEVIEVEEEPETAFMPDTNEQVKIMTQGQWMKGCPEGGEQGFLFGLYNELSSGDCPCPQSCGHRIQRSKSNFFAIFVCKAIHFTKPRANLHIARFLVVYPTSSLCRKAHLSCMQSGFLFRVRRTYQHRKQS